jgi:hypothetical protein
MLRELPVVDSIELKGHRIDLLTSGLERTEIALVRTPDGVENGHVVALGHDRRYRQLQIRKSGTKPNEVPLEGFAPWTLPGQMIVVVQRDDLVKDSQVAAFKARDVPAPELRLSREPAALRWNR